MTQRQFFACPPCSGAYGSPSRARRTVAGTLPLIDLGPANHGCLSQCYFGIMDALVTGVSAERVVTIDDESRPL
jgi:hypothetical protein